jgi:hypothetical protein
VPLINGEPPATLNSSRESDASNLLQCEVKYLSVTYKNKTHDRDQKYQVSVWIQLLLSIATAHHQGSILIPKCSVLLTMLSFFPLTIGRVVGSVDI